MKPIISIIVPLAFAVSAGAQMLRTEHMRVGAPQAPPPNVVRSAADPSEMDGLHTPTNAFDPVLEAELDAPDSSYGYGTTPTLTVRLRRVDGSLMAGDVYTDDDHEKTPRKGRRGKGGEYTVELDNTPGEHFVDVHADVVVDGASTHRGVSVFYEVGTGQVVVVGVGSTRQDATTLYVPLILNCTVPAWYEFHGNLVSKGTVVARALTTANVQPGVAVELQFALADLVEPGPYGLADVVVMAGGLAHHALADARRVVGGPIVVRLDKNVPPPAPPPTLSPQEQADKDAILRPSAPQLQ